MQSEVELFDQFPALFRSVLKCGTVSFPPGTKFEYHPFPAYRAVSRKEGDDSPVSRQDMRSRAERGKKAVRGLVVDPTDPHHYGVSLFTSKVGVENAMKLPRPNKKIAAGFVYQEGGPQEANQNTGHVCWWLYDGIEIKGFKVI